MARKIKVVQIRHEKLLNHKLIIFDMDGTILNTIEDITNAVNYILSKYELTVRRVDEVKFFVGNGLKKTLLRSVPVGTDETFVDGIYPEFTDYYKAHSRDNTKPYDGIVEVIKELKAKGYKLAVVSNKRHEAVLELCDEFFEGCFDVAMGDQEGINIKPAPDMVEAVLKQTGCKKEEAVYIGDSDVDIMTAHNSGLSCISVSWGFRSKDFLIEHKAEVIIDSPKELFEMF